MLAQAAFGQEADAGLLRVHLAVAAEAEAAVLALGQGGAEDAAEPAIEATPGDAPAEMQ